MLRFIRFDVMARSEVAAIVVVCSSHAHCARAIIQLLNLIPHGLLSRMFSTDHKDREHARLARTAVSRKFDAQVTKANVPIANAEELFASIPKRERLGQENSHKTASRMDLKSPRILLPIMKKNLALMNKETMISLDCQMTLHI